MKDGFAFEWRQGVTSIAGAVLFDKKTMGEPGNWNQLQTQSSHEFLENDSEWVYQAWTLSQNNIMHTYKIIICQNYEQALLKYTPYSAEIHKGAPIEVPAQPGK